MMSLSDHLAQPTKRQRSTDVVQDTPKTDFHKRSKRLKSDREGHQQDIESPKASKSLVKNVSEWSLDIVFRGQAFDIEPVFSSDENYLFLSLGNAVQIYSISARRAIRIVQLEDTSYVTGIKPAPSDPRYLYISTSSGKLIHWNWETNSEVAKWANFQELVCHEILHVNVGDEDRTACFSVKKREDKRWVIVFNALWLPPSKKATEIVVYDSPKALDRLKVLKGGHVIVASAGQHLVIGTLNQVVKEGRPFNDYAWREYRLPAGQITSLDARESHDATVQSPSATSTSIDIAIGDASGVILLYQDVLNSRGRGAANDVSTSGLPLLRRMHWHRDAVSSVSWSRDGNYIISGGKEAVIVFWQLDSGRQNFLPHFSSSIRNITLSPAGALYAIQLTEKSITILSATELEPVATIYGLQLPSSRTSMGSKDQNRYSRQGPAVSIPTILHPHRPECLSMAVPGGDSGDLSFLQTFNVRTGTHISRQALTRTNITLHNKGPEGMPISTPSVKFMDMSVDGKWLITVDCWRPQIHDLKAFGPSVPSGNAKLGEHREIFLKFWLWNDTQETWDLVTLVESPHYLTDSPAEILCLAARPGRHEFVTFGADMLLKVWQPTARYARSVKNQPRSGPMEHTWKCQTQIDLTGYAGFKDEQVLCNPAMTFSEDGSVLALSTKDGVQILDAHQWVVYCSRSILSSDAPLSVQFLKNSLIVLSQHSVVSWNVVDNCLKIIGSPNTTSGHHNGFISLAASSSTGTFAVTYSVKSKNVASEPGSKSTHGITIYNASTLASVFEAEMDQMPLSVLSDASTGDYIVLDTAANLRRISCHDRKNQNLGMTTVKGHKREAIGLGDIFGQASRVASKPLAISAQEQDSDVQLKGLDGIFDRTPSFALPPATTLFNDVIKSLVASS